MPAAWLTVSVSKIELIHQAENSHKTQGNVLKLWSQRNKFWFLLMSCISQRCFGQSQCILICAVLCTSCQTGNAWIFLLHIQDGFHLSYPSNLLQNHTTADRELFCCHHMCDWSSARHGWDRGECQAFCRISHQTHPHSFLGSCTKTHTSLDAWLRQGGDRGTFPWCPGSAGHLELIHCVLSGRCLTKMQR